MGKLAIISLVILLLLTLSGALFVEKKISDQLKLVLATIVGIFSTFLGVTLGLYLTNVENKQLERDNTFKYLYVAQKDIETAQNLVISIYYDELNKFHGKHIENKDVLHVGSSRKFEIPFPLTIKTILKSDVFPKHLPFRLYEQLNFCYHNQVNTKKLIQTSAESESKTNDLQLVRELRDYIILLSFSYYCIKIELDFEQGKFLNEDAVDKYEQGFEITKKMLKNKECNQLLNKELKKLVVEIN